MGILNLPLVGSDERHHLSKWLFISGVILGSGAQASAQSAQVPITHTPLGLSSSILTPSGGGCSTGDRQKASPAK
jgi:hypothetical protein